MPKLFLFEIRYISAVRICLQNVDQLISIFSCSQSDVEELLEQHLIMFLCLLFIS
jgi:hypothetical protein